MNNQHRVNIAIRKAGIQGWQPYLFEIIGNDCLITGGVPEISKNGKKRWRGKGTRVIVSDMEFEDEWKRYEAQTGNCGSCLGNGEEMASWSRTEGIKMRPCARCKGSGKAEG